MPAIIFISVLLPAPFSPMSTFTLPRSTSKETWSSALVPGYIFSICSQCRTTFESSNIVLTSLDGYRHGGHRDGGRLRSEAADYLNGLAHEGVQVARGSMTFVRTSSLTVLAYWDHSVLVGEVLIGLAGLAVTHGGAAEHAADLDADLLVVHALDCHEKITLGAVGVVFLHGAGEG